MSEETGVVHRVLLVGTTGANLHAVKVDPEYNDDGTEKAPAALAVNTQDQHTPPLNGYIHRHLQEDLAFAVAPSVGDWTITLAAGHGFTGAGEQIYILEDTGLGYTNYQIMNTTGVAGNVISLDAMIDWPYTIAGATIYRISDEMAVNGSVTPVTFHAYPPPGRVYDITGFRIIINCATTPDDGDFGDLAALTNGVNIHALVAEGVPFALGTFHRNGDFFRVGGNLVYSDKGPSGTFGIHCDALIRYRWGVTVRLRGTVAGQVYTRDEVRIVVRDDLTGLGSFKALVYGHVVQ